MPTGPLRMASLAGLGSPLSISPLRYGAPPATVSRYCDEARVTVSVALRALPLASRAVMVKVVAPACSVRLLIVHEVVPVAVPLLLRSLIQLTLVTLTLSLAVPLMLMFEMVVEKMPLVVGEVMAMVGAALSVKPS